MSLKNEFKNLFGKILSISCLLTSVVFASEDCPEADDSDNILMLTQLVFGKQTVAEIIKAQLKDCKEKPYVYAFKKIDVEKNANSELLEMFGDTTISKIDKITKFHTAHELSENELNFYPKNKIKMQIIKANKYSEPDTSYYIDTIFYDTIWTVANIKKGHSDKWPSSEKPFFSVYSLDEYSKQQFRFEEKYDDYYGNFIADKYTFVSKQDMKLKLQGNGFREQITTLLSYADKNKIGIYYYISTDETLYALVVAKRKYAKYISGEFFNK
jgi:hypothetical protein